MTKGQTDEAKPGRVLLLLQHLTNTCYSLSVLAKTYVVLVMPELDESRFVAATAAVSHCPATIVAKLIFGASRVVLGQPVMKQGESTLHLNMFKV